MCALHHISHNPVDITKGIYSKTKLISPVYHWLNIVKPRFLFKTADIWSYIMPIDRYSHAL